MLLYSQNIKSYNSVNLLILLPFDKEMLIPCQFCHID